MPACQHARWAIDNVVTSCLDCDEQWTAVTIADWPVGCTSMYAGPGLGDACGCGAAWVKVPGFVYCGRCDMEGTD